MVVGYNSLSLCCSWGYWGFNECVIWEDVLHSNTSVVMAAVVSLADYRLVWSFGGKNCVLRRKKVLCGLEYGLDMSREVEDDVSRYS